MTLPLSGSAALVTGGGSGIGLACARHLLADGASVTLMGRREERVREAAEGLRAEAPEGAVTSWSAGSVAEEEAVQRAVKVATAVTGALDIAVLAAGVGAAGPLLLTEHQAWEGVLATNLTGAFLTLKHAGAAMARTGGGSVVAVSSVAAVRTHRFMAAYCVSKAGLDALVRNAADELGVAGVRVCSVRPGLVPTDMAARLEADDQVRGDYLAQMPVGRLGSVDDVAALVRFLAGPESSWVTGECISVDGGHHLRRGPDIEPWMRALFGDDAVEGRL
jgi:NAD(P)-dependent dehydrogenase (short-subunit alcohol dehydrogenase family)